jgi:hypothetical protein
MNSAKGNFLAHEAVFINLVCYKEKNISSDLKKSFIINHKEFELNFLGVVRLKDTLQKLEILAI